MASYLPFPSPRGEHFHPYTQPTPELFPGRYNKWGNQGTQTRALKSSQQNVLSAFSAFGHPMKTGIDYGERDS